MELKKCYDYFSPVLSPSDADFFHEMISSLMKIMMKMMMTMMKNGVDITTYTFWPCYKLYMYYNFAVYFCVLFGICSINSTL